VLGVPVADDVALDEVDVVELVLLDEVVPTGDGDAVPPVHAASSSATTTAIEAIVQVLFTMYSSSCGFAATKMTPR
jgi:hypothetical protein